jgi:predicted transcriptional regulator
MLSLFPARTALTFFCFLLYLHNVRTLRGEDLCAMEVISDALIKKAVHLIHHNGSICTTEDLQRELGNTDNETTQSVIKKLEQIGIVKKKESIVPLLIRTYQY